MDIPLYDDVDGILQCLLCPHFCALSKGGVGKCSARYNNGKEIVHINLGAISCMAVEPIEKKPLKHFLPGSKTLTIGSYGCNLNCSYCENHKISQVSPPKKSKVWRPGLVAGAASAKHCKSVNMSYNEPILSYEYLINLAHSCMIHELDFILKTNAYVNKDPWREICLVTDAMNIDYKGSEDRFKSITGAGSYVLKDRIKEAYDMDVHIEISVPLYYKDDELEDEMYILGKFLSSIDSNIPCHLSRISPSYQFDDFIFNPKNLEKAKDILSMYISNIYFVA